MIGNHEVRIHQARSGGLLIDVRGYQKQVETVKAEVSRSAGGGVEVKTLGQRNPLEVRDLDEWTSKQEMVVDMMPFTGGNTGSI